MNKLIGLTILSLKSAYGEKRSRNPSHREVAFILFDDRKTFIKLEEQDYYTFHDCSGCAREIRVIEDTARWEYLLDNHLDAEMAP